jgi:aquaporin NIP
MKKYRAEFIGTFALVFAGTGAIVINETSGGAITHVGISLTFGLIVLAMIYTVGDISGAHLNPAVSLGFFAATISIASSNSISAKSMCWSVCGQRTPTCSVPRERDIRSNTACGIGHAVIRARVDSHGDLNVCHSQRFDRRSRKRDYSWNAVGAVIALEAMFAGPISDASMNPARSLAPAVVSQHLSSLWIYLVAPVIGASLGVIGCRCVREEGCCSTQYTGTTSVS